MKKNLYFRAMFRRNNALKEFIYAVFTSIASWPRLLLEVFIRRNFGERYFSMYNAIVMSLLLAAIPALIAFGPWNYYTPPFGDFLLNNISWYLFQAGFLYACVLRQREITLGPSVFDFGRFSLSSGEVHPEFYRFTFRGRKFSSREIETLLEPGLFLIIGAVLASFGQLVGVLILVSSIVYSMSYMAAYKRGDDFVMDKIDEMICNQEVYNAFVDGIDPSKTRGVNFFGRRPADPETRKRVADLFTEDSEEAVEAE